MMDVERVIMIRDRKGRVEAILTLEDIREYLAENPHVARNLLYWKEAKDRTEREARA